MPSSLFHSQWPALLVIIVTMVGVAVGRYPFLRMNRATIALTGATILILLGAIELDAAYAALDLNTLTLLFAMMILNGNLRRAGFFQLVAYRVIHWAHAPWQLLALTILVTGILSALFLNDTIVLVFTPLLLEICLLIGQPVLPYLMALATAANLGSVATLTGNPQNMLIGMASGISYIDFSQRLAPIALVGMLIIWLLILVVYRTEMAARFTQPPVLSLVVERPLLWKSLGATLLLLIALLAGMAPPLAALGAASLLLITRRTDPELVFREIDWSLLVFFGGLFVVTGTLETLGISAQLFQFVQPLAAQGVAAFTLVAALLSNLISNVPAVLLLKPFSAELSNPTQSWLILAMATTLAGNLTLLGSVANLIVAEIARREGVELTFREYLKAGLPITLLSLLFGIFWLQ